MVESADLPESQQRRAEDHFIFPPKVAVDLDSCGFSVSLAAFGIDSPDAHDATAAFHSESSPFDAIDPAQHDRSNPFFNLTPSARRTRVSAAVHPLASSGIADATASNAFQAEIISLRDQLAKSEASCTQASTLEVENERLAEGQ
jgi:hypothetical protein